jgi:hypothetical protein
VPWEGVAPLVLLVVLHALYGLAVGSWWSLLTPVALWFVLLTVPPCNGELCDAGSKAFFLAWYWVASLALVALGVCTRRLVRARRAT